MSKGRLEEIEVQGYENDGDNRLFVKLKEDDYLYLREQTERVQELEEEVDRLNGALHYQLTQENIRNEANRKPRKQNKRYREAIKKAIEKLTWNSVESGKILLKELEELE